MDLRLFQKEDGTLCCPSVWQLRRMVLAQRTTPPDSISYLAKATNRPPRPMATQRLFKTPMEPYDVAGKTG
jgi:hypothetical protein